MSESGIQFLKTAILLFGVSLVPVVWYALRKVKTAFDGRKFVGENRFRILLLFVGMVLLSAIVTADANAVSGLAVFGGTIYLLAFGAGGVVVAAIGSEPDR